MEYPALKTFATLSSTFILHAPSLDSFTLNIHPLVYQPNRKKKSTFTKDRRISLISEHAVHTQDN